MAQVVHYYDDGGRLLGEGVIHKEIDLLTYSVWKFTRDLSWETNFGNARLFRNVPCVLLDSNPILVHKVHIEIIERKFLGVRSIYRGHCRIHIM